jgi:hypothetical protein
MPGRYAGCAAAGNFGASLSPVARTWCEPPQTGRSTAASGLVPKIAGEADTTYATGA